MRGPHVVAMDWTGDPLWKADIASSAIARHVQMIKMPRALRIVVIFDVEDDQAPLVNRTFFALQPGKIVINRGVTCLGGFLKPEPDGTVSSWLLYEQEL